LQIEAGKVAPKKHLKEEGIVTGDFVELVVVVVVVGASTHLNTSELIDNRWKLLTVKTYGAYGFGTQM
jgi:hypothetical protein